MDWTLPTNLATHGANIDRLYTMILIITGIAFVLVEVGILWFVVRYRHREGRAARYLPGDNRLELVWTALPALVLVFLGFYSGRIWASIKAPSSIPEDAFTIEVRAKQFEWNFIYAGTDGRTGTPDDVTERNHLQVPAERPVLLRMQSEDVIHSFFIPELRVKQDVVPGMTTLVWFEATRPAELQLGCAELCGLGHYRMRARVTVHPPAAFEAWLAGRATAGADGD